jgi:outer membrane protein assembly factor BamA
LGGNSSQSDKTLVDYKHLRVHQNALKNILPHMYAGLGYSLDQHFNIQIEETEFSDNVIGKYIPGDKTTSTSSGISLPLLYDSRKNSGNPQQGLMMSFTYNFFNTHFGSDNNWQSLFFDIRKYFPLSNPGQKYSILAFRGYYWTVVTGRTPYLDLPANRWEPISGSASRGIRQNRYRSNAMLYFESEYRFGIIANDFLGGVVFASVLAPSQYGTQHFQYWHPAAGTGLRLKFNKYSNTNISIDFGFSKEFATIYLSIGEAF